jgi:hypothetical protein
MRTNIFATSAENIRTTQRRIKYFKQKMCVNTIGYDVNLGYINPYPANVENMVSS